MFDTAFQRFAAAFEKRADAFTGGLESHRRTILRITWTMHAAVAGA